jgi:hypothetical protein
MGLHTQQVRLAKAAVIAIGAGNYKPGFLYIATDAPYEFAYGQENSNLSAWINPATLGSIYNFNDTQTVNLTQIGANITADVLISSQAGNDIIATATGIYSPAMTIGAASAPYLDITAGVLTIKSLGIVKTTTDASATTLAAALTTAGYAAATLVFQNSDMIILPAATGGSQIWLHNGGAAGTVADFVQLEAPPLSAAYIRSQFSATAPIAYNASTGAITFGSANGLSVSGANLILGGALTQDTTFTGAFRMNFNNTGNVSIGGTTGVSKLTVFGGDIEIDTATSGLILKNGAARWRVTVDANGTLTTASI